MDKADLLVGVTMPERGVSRRVAVKLSQIANDGTIRDIEAVNRAAAKEARAAASAGEPVEVPPQEGSSPDAPSVGVVALSNGHEDVAGASERVKEAGSDPETVPSAAEGAVMT